MAAWNPYNVRKLQVAILVGILLALAFYSSEIHKNLVYETKQQINATRQQTVQDIFDKFLDQNQDQSLIPKAILKQTLKYMIEERDEYDPELIAFVSSLIHRPEQTRRLNLSRKDTTDFSQIGQSKYIDGLLGAKRNGFFIECGAFDGELFSNSLFFELERNWSGENLVIR